MQRLSTVLVLLPLIYVLITGCGGEEGGIAGRINAVENSLIPAVIGADEEPPLMNLEDRMRHYKVPAVGIERLSSKKSTQVLLQNVNYELR
jgi:hypothetical protein